jgi:hypothetical protein
MYWILEFAAAMPPPSSGTENPNLVPEVEERACQIMNDELTATEIGQTAIYIQYNVHRAPAL